jgi:hypothetical protein
MAHDESFEQRLLAKLDRLIAKLAEEVEASHETNRLLQAVVRQGPPAADSAPPTPFAAADHRRAPARPPPEDPRPPSPRPRDPLPRPTPPRPTPPRPTPPRDDRRAMLPLPLPPALAPAPEPPGEPRTTSPIKVQSAQKVEPIHADQEHPPMADVHSSDTDPDLQFDE